jgi:hypothetical protein
MELIVLKYLALAGITYGTYAYLAGAQILLCVYLVTNGLVLVSSKERLGKCLDKGARLNTTVAWGHADCLPRGWRKRCRFIYIKNYNLFSPQV